MASASIGQVHRARLPPASAVVVKVQQADIERKMEVDLDILAGLAQLAETHARVPQLSPAATVAEISAGDAAGTGLRPRAAQHAAVRPRFRGRSDGPRARTYPELSTRRVLTMERIDGIPLSQAERLRGRGARPGRNRPPRGRNLYLKMIFVNGFYHADPHPGNVMVLPGDVFGLLDFGMVGRIDERLHEDIGEMLRGARATRTPSTWPR